MATQAASSPAASSQNGSSQNGSSQSTASPARRRSRRGRTLVGHTCAWKVDQHLTRAIFEDLTFFCGLSPNLSGTIQRKQLEIAVREASKATDRKLRLVRRDVVDATGEDADELPVVGKVDKKYKLTRGRLIGTGRGTYRTLREEYRKAQDTIHTTVVAQIIKRYVRRALAGFSLRDHGGVYFVSQKLEDDLFRLADFLRSEEIGHITHFGVGGDEHETRVLSEEIQRNVEEQIEKIRDAFDEADLSDTRDRSRLRKKVRDMRGELTEMEELFGFARNTLKEKDTQVRSLMREIIRGTRDIDGADLFTPSGSGADQDPGPTDPSGDGQTTGGTVPKIDYAAS